MNAASENPNRSVSDDEKCARRTENGTTLITINLGKSIANLMSLEVVFARKRDPKRFVPAVALFAEEMLRLEALLHISDIAERTDHRKRSKGKSWMLTRRTGSFHLRSKYRKRSAPFTYACKDDRCQNA